MQDYPEHEKLHAANEKGSQQIGEFLDWLTNEQGVVLAEYPDNRHDLWPTRKTIEAWLALYFGLDLDKIEEEKQAMLDELRKES